MKAREEISLKELALIEILDEKTQSQRSIARASGFSLGMTNLLLKRLTTKGHIKVITLNGRTLRYILTPRGFAEKVKRSYDFVLRSIQSLNDLKSRIQEAIPETSSLTQVYVIGDSEIATLARNTLKERGIQVHAVHPGEIELPQLESEDSIVLNCEMDPDASHIMVSKKQRLIHLIHLMQ